MGKGPSRKGHWRGQMTFAFSCASPSCISWLFQPANCRSLLLFRAQQPKPRPAFPKRAIDSATLLARTVTCVRDEERCKQWLFDCMWREKELIFTIIYLVVAIYTRRKRKRKMSLKPPILPNKNIEARFDRFLLDFPRSKRAKKKKGKREKRGRGLRMLGI